MPMQASKMKSLKRIAAVNFAMEDLSLYLNTHPMDCEAVGRYNAFVIEANALKQNHERYYGMISEHSSQSPCPWQWINEPWPWEYEANFRLNERQG